MGAPLDGSASNDGQNANGVATEGSRATSRPLATPSGPAVVKAKHKKAQPKSTKCEDRRPPTDLAVGLTVEELRALVRSALRAELDVQPKELDEILTREQAAALLHLHPNVVTRYVKEHDLPGRKIGNEWRFRRSELLAWLDTQGEKE
jgi:excisionase family DNA binding protein